VSKDPDLNPAIHTNCNVYYMPLKTFVEPFPPKPIAFALPSEFQGASSSPVFSPDGKSAAFLSMLTDGYESDKNQIFLVPDVGGGQGAVRLLAGESLQGKWHRSPHVSFEMNGRKQRSEGIDADRT